MINNKTKRMIEIEITYYLAKYWDTFVERANIYVSDKGLAVEIFMVLKDSEENVGFAIERVIEKIQKERRVEFCSSKVFVL